MQGTARWRFDVTCHGTKGGDMLSKRHVAERLQMTKLVSINRTWASTLAAAGNQQMTAQGMVERGKEIHI